MGFRVATNYNALQTERMLQKNTQNSNRVLGQVASGDRITQAAVDPSGLAISEKLKAKVRSQGQGIRNTNDAVSLFQVAEGALNEMSSMAVRLRELSMASATDTYSDSERSMMSMEFNNLKSEIQRIAQSTEYNGQRLLNGNGKTYDFQVGVHNEDNERLSFNTQKLNSSLDALNATNLSISSKENARSSLKGIDQMISSLSDKRATLGAKSKRLYHAAENLKVGEVNTMATNSRIRDTDMAEAMSKKVSLDLIQNATVSAMGQTSIAPQNALKLIS